VIWGPCSVITSISRPDPCDSDETILNVSEQQTHILTTTQAESTSLQLISFSYPIEKQQKSKKKRENRDLMKSYLRCEKDSKPSFNTKVLSIWTSPKI